MSIMEGYSKPYAITDWYWFVAGDANNVYSSARNIYVPVADAAYTTWLGDSGFTSSIASEAELWEVLYPALPTLQDWMFDGTTFVQPAEGTYTQAQLAGYSSSVRYECEIQGVSSTGESIRTDRVSRTAANQTLVYINANPTLTVNWKTLTGFSVLDQAAVVQHTTDINAHVQTCFDTESSVAGQITAGTITTLAEIDAAYQSLRTKAPPELKGRTKIEI